MYYIGLDVHKKTISYCVKDASGRVHREGKLGATRCELDDWMRTLPQPWTVAMEATIFTGWIYDHLRPHATQVRMQNQTSSPSFVRAPALSRFLRSCYDKPVARFPVISYWRFMGGSDRIRIISGHLGQSVQHMQIVQSRINTADFASC